MKIPFLSKTRETKLLHPCKHPRTLSFRVEDDIYKTVNSVFLDPIIDGIETPESCFTNSSETSTSLSTDQSEDFGGESLEKILHGVRSERLFFEPGHTRSIIEEAKPGGFPYKESVVIAMESENPYLDFRRSMEEMVESHGIKDKECLEELLLWYLKANGKKNHGFIVGAFIDLLVGIAASSYSDSNTSFSSAVSSFPSSALCSMEIEEEQNIVLS